MRVERPGGDLVRQVPAGFRRIASLDPGLGISLQSTPWRALGPAPLPFPSHRIDSPTRMPKGALPPRAGHRTPACPGELDILVCLLFLNFNYFDLSPNAPVINAHIMYV